MPTVPISALPWEVDSKRDSECGDYFVIVRQDGKVILDTFNSEVACIFEESDGNENGVWRNRWDAQGRADLDFVVEAVNNHARLTTEATALREALSKCERCLTELYPSRVEDAEHEAEYYAVNRVINEARAALAPKGADKP